MFVVVLLMCCLRNMSIKPNHTMSALRSNIDEEQVNGADEVKSHVIRN